MRAPNKKERLVDFLWAKLPYHPQYLRHGTRFDAPLVEALQFGTESVKLADLAKLGSQPAPDSVVRARLLTALDSASAKQGQTVEAVLAAPLFSPDRKLVLPQGTRLVGMVTLAKGARSFHRGGQLRFNFQQVDLPAEIAKFRLAAPESPSLTTQATLDAAEGSGPARIKVDSEGGVQPRNRKRAVIAPAFRCWRVPTKRQIWMRASHRSGRVGRRCKCLRSHSGRRFGIWIAGHGALAEFALRRDGVRILRLGMVCVLECDRQRGRGAIR